MKYTAHMLLQRAIFATNPKPTEIVMSLELYRALVEESWNPRLGDPRGTDGGTFLGIPVRIEDGVYIPRGV